MRVQSDVLPKSLLLRDLDEPLARRLLVRRRDRVFEVAEQHIDLRDELRDLRAHLLVLRREEVDHAVRPRGHLALRRGRADRERPGEGAGVTHASRYSMVRARLYLRPRWGVKESRASSVPVREHVSQ